MSIQINGESDSATRFFIPIMCMYMYILMVTCMCVYVCKCGYYLYVVVGSVSATYVHIIQYIHTADEWKYSS